MNHYKNKSLDNIPNEIWKDIEGFKGIYQISNMGRIKSIERTIIRQSKKHHIKPRIISQSLDKNGYLRSSLTKDGYTNSYSVHRLVALTFICNPDNKPQVNHIDECKTNNTVDNLEWMTCYENNNYGTRNDRIKKTFIENDSMKNRKMNITHKRKVKCITTGEIYDSVTDACKAHNIKSRSSISAVCKGTQKCTYNYKTGVKLEWVYIEEEEEDVQKEEM